jgi:hypothetical protein
MLHFKVKAPAGAEYLGMRRGEGGRILTWRLEDGTVTETYCPVFNLTPGARRRAFRIVRGEGS